MSKILSIKIQCTNCKQWFNSPIRIGDTETFETSILSGNKGNCPYCAKITDLDKDNMKVVHENGEIVGKLVG